MTAPARADERGGACIDPRITVVLPLPARWEEPLARACRELILMPDVDPTARVRVASSGDDLTIDVTLADGRTAQRALRRPEALRPTLEALLIVPPDDATVEAVTRPAAPSPAALVEHPEPREEHAPTPRREGRVEIGGGAGGRVAGGGYISFAPAAFAQLTIARWLFGMMFRWDVIEQKNNVATLNVFEMETVGVGLLAGRRFALDLGSLDLGVSPRLLSETQTFETQSTEQSRTTTDIRLGTFARLAFGHGALRPMLELDAELSPARLRREVFLDPVLPAVPAWSAGLTAGVSWSSP